MVDGVGKAGRLLKEMVDRREELKPEVGDGMKG